MSGREGESSCSLLDCRFSGSDLRCEALPFQVRCQLDIFQLDIFELDIFQIDIFQLGRERSVIDEYGLTPGVAGATLI